MVPPCLYTVIYTAYGSCTLYEFRDPHSSLQRVYEIAISFTMLITTWCIAVSGVGLVHLVYNAQRDIPVCIKFIYTAYGSCTPYVFMEPRRSLQRVYEIVVCFRLLAMTWCSIVSVDGLIHLVYNSLRDLPVCVQFIYTA